MKKIIMGFIDMWKADYQFKTLATLENGSSIVTKATNFSLPK